MNVFTRQPKEGNPAGNDVSNANN